MSQDFVVIGQIGAPYGVKGWQHIRSFSKPIENIFQYKTWYLRQKQAWLPYQVATGRRHGEGLVVHLEGIDDRDIAASLTLCDIAIPRSELKPLPQDEYYWTDLEGLSVKTLAGKLLGRIAYLYDNAGTDIMVIQSEGELEKHIPFVIQDTVHAVDLENKEVIVDWDL